MKPLITARPRPTVDGDIEIQNHGNITVSTSIWKILKERYISVKLAYTMSIRRASRLK